MSVKASILFYELGNFSIKHLQKLSDNLIASPFSDEKGFGFQNINTHISYLSASLLKRNPTYITEYNAETNKILKTQIFVYSNIKFVIDADYNLLEIYSSQKDSSKVRSALSNLFENNVTIKQINLSPFEILKLLREHCKIVKITKLSILNFNYLNKAYGSFNISKIDNDFIDELFEQHQNEIKKITLLVDFENITSVELSINESGQISIKSKDFDDALLIVKNTILKK
jgi:hypothetical protein